jgi:hypothetical protein
VRSMTGLLLTRRHGEVARPASGANSFGNKAGLVPRGKDFRSGRNPIMPDELYYILRLSGCFAR